MKVIICNSFPQTGKDEFIKYLNRTYGVNHLEFKRKLIELTKMIYSVSDELWNSIYVSGEKDIPRPIFNGKTAREALIYISEVVIKPNFGSNYFGLDAASKLVDGINGFSDGGFYDEMVEVTNVTGASNAIIVRIHKEGTARNGDSRREVDIEGVEVINVSNNGSLKDLHRQADAIYNYLLHVKTTNSRFSWDDL